MFLRVRDGSTFKQMGTNPKSSQRGVQNSNTIAISKESWKLVVDMAFTMAGKYHFGARKRTPTRTRSIRSCSSWDNSLNRHSQESIAQQPTHHTSNCNQGRRKSTCIKNEIKLTPSLNHPHLTENHNSQNSNDYLHQKKKMIWETNPPPNMIWMPWRENVMQRMYFEECLKTWCSVQEFQPKLL